MPRAASALTRDLISSWVAAAMALPSMMVAQIGDLYIKVQKRYCTKNTLKTASIWVCNGKKCNNNSKITLNFRVVCCVFDSGLGSTWALFECV